MLVSIGRDVRVYKADKQFKVCLFSVTTPYFIWGSFQHISTGKCRVLLGIGLSNFDATGSDKFVEAVICISSRTR